MKAFDIWAADCVGGPKCGNARDRGTREQNKPYILANSWCQVTNSLFKRVWDLPILKVGSKFRIKISDFRYAIWTCTSTWLLDMQVPELCYKAFKKWNNIFFFLLYAKFQVCTVISMVALGQPADIVFKDSPLTAYVFGWTYMLCHLLPIPILFVVNIVRDHRTGEVRIILLLWSTYLWIAVKKVTNRFFGHESLS